MIINNITDSVKNLSQRVTHFVVDVESTVSECLFEKEKRDEKIKKISTSLESLLKEVIQKVQSDPVQVKIKTLPHYMGELPKYESTLASGFDVRAVVDQSVTLAPGERHLVPTGLSFEIPEGYEIQVRPRSGLAIKNGLSMVNSPGTIDADYRGEVKVILINHGQDDYVVENQQRIAQFVVCPIVQAEFEYVEDLSESDRGEKGFGSTGVN